MPVRKRLSQQILIFATAFFSFLIIPAFIKTKVPFFTLLKVGDLVDILTPIVLLPLYWLLFQINENTSFSKKEVAVFLVFAAFFTQGQGMHLAANAIAELLKNTAATDVSRLTYFFDELLSHYIWFIGINGLTSVLLFRQWHSSFKEKVSITRFEILASILYGVTYFITGVEGQTAPIGIPFAILVCLFGIIYGRNQFKKQPVLFFFFLAHLLSLILFASWGFYWGGLPEFSKVGLI